MLFLTINAYQWGRLPDNFIDAAGTTYDIGTGLSDLNSKGKNDKAGSAGKVNPASINSKTPNLSVDPMFLKKGNIIYHRDAGTKTRVNGDGTQNAIFDNTPATDTFPRNKIPPNYTYPH